MMAGWLPHQTDRQRDMGVKSLDVFAEIVPCSFDYLMISALCYLRISCYPGEQAWQSVLWWYRPPAGIGGARRSLQLQTCLPTIGHARSLSTFDMRKILAGNCSSSRAYYWWWDNHQGWFFFSRLTWTVDKFLPRFVRPLFTKLVKIRKLARGRQCAVRKSEVENTKSTFD